MEQVFAVIGECAVVGAIGFSFFWEFAPIHMRAMEPEAAEEIRDAAICLAAKLDR